ncbi:MAG TPA: hypothetical protein VLD39_04095 [Gammaproteobacteria bacterium]|nr:hypothetical protein [Gammaproteobacteria bacterium]
MRLETRFDRVKFRAEVSNLNFPAGETLLVCHNGNSLGDIVLNSLRFGELELDSRLGHSIPLSGGERIELYRGPCGSELLMAANLGGSTVSSSASTTSPSASNSSSSSSSTTSSSTSTMIEGKTRKLINGFEAELNIRFERRPDRDKFRGEAENLNLGQGTRLEFCYNGSLLGDIVLNSFNFGELELDSRLVHSVPTFQPGEVIELRQGGCGGSLIMAATFGGSTVTGGGNNNGGSATTSTTRQEIEGKTRRPINGFEAEFSVRFEQRFDRDKIRAEVSNLNLTVGRRLTVCYGGTALGDLVLNSLHFAELELDSRLGHNVPVLSIGDVVELSPSSCGVTPLMSVRMQAAE